jgi:hypothetical protein
LGGGGLRRRGHAVEDAPHLEKELLEVERLADERRLVHPDRIRMGSDDQRGRAAEQGALMRFTQHGRARLAGKVVVAQDHVEAAAAQRHQPPLGVGGLGHAVALRLQGHGQELARVVVVFDEEDLPHGACSIWQRVTTAATGSSHFARRRAGARPIAPFPI